MPVNITIDPKFLATMQKAAAQFPDAFKKAESYAVTAAKKQFGSIMRSGGKPSKGVPKFRQDKLTAEIKTHLGVKSYRADYWRRNDDGTKELVHGEAMANGKTMLFDGEQVQFATDDKFHVAFKTGATWHVGFPKKVDSFLGPLLEAQTKSFEEQTIWRIRHDTGVQVPPTYSRPQRMILEPWGKRLAEGEYLRWLLGSLGKGVRRKCGLQLMYGAMHK